VAALVDNAQMRGRLLAGSAAAVVVAIGLGFWFTRPIADRGPVAGSPTPQLTSSPVGASPSATAPSATPSPTAPSASQAQSVYIWRDGLPPLLATAPGANPQLSIEERVRERLEAINNSVSGLTGTVLRAEPKQFYVRAVKVQGDTATIDYSARFPPAGSLWDVALAQQIVFTATEEPTILRVLVTENGKPMNTGHLLWDKALTREEVDGYSAKVEQSLADPGTGNVPAAELRLSTSYSVDTFSPGLARFIVQVDRSTGSLPPGFRPKFDIQLHGPSTSDQSGLRGKASLALTMPGAPAKVGLENVDRSPLRSINTIPWNDGSMFQLKIDAQYPWRALVLNNPTRLVVDIGGMLESVSDRVAVYSPASMVHFELVAGRTPPPPLGRQFTVSGLARTFEANVVWRVKEGTRTVAEGHATASEGTSAVWGTFSTQVTLPASVRGQVTLEVFEASARDATPVGLVAVPLVID
jgi:hypothetical protein